MFTTFLKNAFSISKMAMINKPYTVCFRMLSMCNISLFIMNSSAFSKLAYFTVSKHK